MYNNKKNVTATYLYIKDQTEAKQEKYKLSWLSYGKSACFKT